MTESRNELLTWVNELLQLSLTRIEQLGTGGALCQIFDTIFRDVPMAKVKMNARQEYEYVQNFKILQATFKKHSMDKVIPVDRLIKCKFQDNLEFFQWVKKYWDTYYPGGHYDPVARRKGIAEAKGNVVKKGPAVLESRKHNLGNEREFVELRAQLDSSAKERDFYFGKLRQIEIAVQKKMEGAIGEEREFLLYVQHVLYSTEDGFEHPSVGVEMVGDVKNTGLVTAEDLE